MSVEDFLKSLGMNGEKEVDGQQGLAWDQILSPSKVGVILGRRRKGKSGLAYFLLEKLAAKYDLLPVVVNLPLSKRHLLPENWVIKSLKDVQFTENACVLIDEGTTMIRAGGMSIEEVVKSFCALAGQRNQIILLIFHASSDVGSRVLRGVDVVFLKEPSKRQIQFGAKDNWMRSLLEEARGKFRTIAEVGSDPRQFTYIDCEEPEFRGMMKNPLCSFWTNDLSKAWSGVDTIESEIEGQLKGTKQLRFDIMKSGMKIKVSQAELEAVIKEMVSNGEDVTELEALLAETAKPKLFEHEPEKTTVGEFWEFYHSLEMPTLGEVAEMIKLRLLNAGYPLKQGVNLDKFSQTLAQKGCPWERGEGCPCLSPTIGKCPILLPT